MKTEEKRYQMVRFGAVIGIAGNILLAIFKGLTGIMTDSRALTADAVHSASDVVGSVAVLIGVRAANLPPDRDHPYGHGKAETVTAIIVAVLLFVVGVEIGLNALQDLDKPVSIPGTAALYAIIFSIIVKEGMFRYKHFLGNKYNSEALITDAWHHRSDVFSSAAALAGVGASIAGNQLDITWMLYGDLAAGLFVSILIMRMAWTLGKTSIHNALDHVLHAEDTKEMRKQVSGVDGVLHVDEFFAREHGHYVIIDIKIAVDPSITVQEGHDIGKRVKEHLLVDEKVKDVFVHINPHEEEN
ncbi:cation diffusion facilitator family transporter [Salibacterium halotolerans]|uniref:Cation diffusion facilitator family transporter n=1 Tax=Salibacterium halotolerans TaxID=1884432 RepID=A0A1I5UE80_9BACI|nr:cation diffusion facilitator family transporter [Salibacterium halotolerans]SFP93590.1 cation diffusion facilitator family transporter [Salibacterium halotolerans]